MSSVILPNALAGLAGGLAGGSPSIPSVLVTVLSVPPMTPITNALPDIPRSYTAICEWAACMVYIAVLYRRVPLRRSIIVSAAGLASLVAVQYFDGSMPIWFWIIGMLLAFACMYATILLGAGTGKREGLYITARVRVGRIGGVAALADRYVHWRARRIRRLRLARDRAACRYVCAVLRSSLDG